MKDCVVKIGIKRSLVPAQSTSTGTIISSPGGSTAAYSPPPGPDNDNDDFVPADLCSPHNYARLPLPVDETRAENDTSTTDVLSLVFFWRLFC